MSAHQALKRATHEAHERLDAHFSAFDLARPDDYRRFLTAHARAYLPAEDALANAPDDWLPSGWREGRRGAALKEDCAALGIDVGPAHPPPTFDSKAEVAGMVYVLEGSRLGGRVLSRLVAPELPSAFLSSIAPKGHWKNITNWLDRQIVTETELDAASRAATEMFGVFERCGEGV